jgi:hypothetical protein
VSIGAEQGPFEIEHTARDDGRRDVDYALTSLQQNMVQFSSLADAKANIMITVCSIVMSVALTQIGRPGFQLPLIALGVFTAISLASALLCVIPSRAVPRLRDGGVDKGSPAFNPLFFLHFQYLTREEFESEINARIANPRALYQSLVRDIYEQGVVLARSKYRYLRVSYLSFMVGLILSLAIALWQVATSMAG